MLEPWKHLTGQRWNHELRQLWLELLPAAENRDTLDAPFLLFVNLFPGPPIGWTQMDTSWHGSLRICSLQMSAPCSRTEQGKSRNKSEGKQARMDWPRGDISIKSGQRQVCSLYHHYLILGRWGVVMKTQKKKTKKLLTPIREFNKMAWYEKHTQESIHSNIITTNC